MNTAIATAEAYVRRPKSGLPVNVDVPARRWSFRKGQSMRGTQFAQLTAFAAVAEHRSFTRAATHLGLSTPSLSQAIRGLEEALGVRLLNRTTRSVALTEAGEHLFDHLSPVLEGVDNAIDSVNAFRDSPTGKLRLSVHPIAALTVVGPVVARFSVAYPGISLEISVDIEHKDIVGDRFDAGIHLGGTIAQDMIAMPIGGDFRLKTVASPDYLARNPIPKSPDDLGEHNCIRYRWGRDQGAQGWKFRKEGSEVEVDVAGTLTVNDLDLALRAGLDGMGIVQLPESSVSELIAAGKLVQVLPDWAPHWGGFVLYYPSRRHVPVKLRALAEILKKESKRIAQPFS